MFENLKIRTRFLILLSVQLLVIITLSGISWSAFGKMINNFNEALIISKEMNQAVDVSREAQVTFKKQVQEWKNILIRGQEPEKFEKYHKIKNILIKDFQVLKKIQKKRRTQSCYSAVYLFL